MKITYQDKTTRHDVFEQNFIMGSVFFHRSYIQLSSCIVCVF